MAEEQQFKDPRIAKRIEKANEITEDLKTKGYERHNATIGLVAANVIALFVMAPLMVLLYLGFDWINPGVIKATVLEANSIASFLALVAMYAFVVIHEGIHGICNWMFNGHDWKSIQFGVHSGTPYCSCQTPLKKWQYIVVLLMPTIILSVGMGIVAIFTGNVFLIVQAMLLALGGGGDMTITLLLCFKAKGKELIILDHPHECGCYYFSKTNTKES